ncbi:MAG: aminoglycoside phosphotransferase family protein, partial [Chloroflexota bacterium]|nr:aminoglycoside phosphotransferase family protein [Chloroflexota bacterium]
HTPLPVVAAAVERVASTPAVALTRLYAGYSNEVYDVTTGDGRALMVRIAHRPEHFLAERWAIERYRAAGIPAPAVLGVSHLTVGGEPLSICVEQRLPGTPLSDLAQEWGRDAPQIVELSHEAGRLLATMHRIPVVGYGRLDDSGRGPYPTWDVFFVDSLTERAARLDGPPVAALRDIVREALDTLEAHRELLRRQPARLLHGDFVPVHLLAHVPGIGTATERAPIAAGPAHRISGILDLEDCLAGDPAFDFARWHPEVDARVGLAPVLAEYAAAAEDIGADFLLRVRLGQLRYSVHWALLTAERGDLPGAETAAGYVRRELARSM